MPWWVPAIVFAHPFVIVAIAPGKGYAIGSVIVLAIVAYWANIAGAHNEGFPLWRGALDATYVVIAYALAMALVYWASMALHKRFWPSARPAAPSPQPAAPRSPSLEPRDP